jgi:hypothetical protein
MMKLPGYIDIFVDVSLKDDEMLLSDPFVYDCFMSKCIRHQYVMLLCSHHNSNPFTDGSEDPNMLDLGNHGS